MAGLPKLDPVFHQPTRTRLAVVLSIEAHSFSQLKSALEIADGNLDAHLRKLSATGYLHSRMVLEARPHTIYQLSSSGSKAFKKYTKTLQLLIDRTRDPQKQPG